MKIRKTLIAASLCLCLFSSLFLSSCGQEEDNLSNPLTRTDETYTGVFTSLGNIKVHSKVTHIFETDDGDVLYAFSDRYDLGSTEYMGTVVEAYGTVSTYESLDKPLFEVKRITDAPAIDAPEEVTSVEYKNTTIGVSFTYPSNWKMEEKLNMISLAEPEKEIQYDPNILLKEVDVEPIKTMEEETGTPDSIWAVRIEAGLTKTSTDENGLRSEEIASYVKNEYADLAALTGDLTYVGADEQFSLRYKTENGDIYYFIPRETSLYELSYQHTNKDDSLLLDNTNVFSNLVAMFRFLPKDGESVEDTTTDTTDDDLEVVEIEPSLPSVEQVEISKFASFNSNIGFSISYPSSWYYLGTSSKYVFTDQKVDFETDTVDSITPVITLTWSSTGTVGTVQESLTGVKVTVDVGGRFYTLTGGANYEELMQKMADSIKSAS